MGNHASSTLGNGGNAKAIKVVLPSNEILRVDGPAKAAELMLDMPGHFLVSSRSMQVGKRFAALSADDELEASSAYVMFPMKRAKDVVAAADMARLMVVANSEARIPAGGGGARVLPETTSPKAKVAAGTKTKLEDLLRQEAMNEEEKRAMELEELRQRIGVCRARRPTLETIPEEGNSFR